MQKLTKKEETELVFKYEPLVNKLVSQFYSSVQCSWDDHKSMAYEGLVLAMRKYDKNRSSQSFTQFAAYAIRNNLLSGLNNELRTVKLSAYAQKKVTDSGGTLFNTVSIDRSVPGDDSEDSLKPREVVMNMYENEKFSNGDVLQYLYSRLNDQFTTIDREIFYYTYGLNGHEEMSGKQIAKHFMISEGRVSQRLKKVLEFIRQDKDLCEMLATLREGVH